MNVFGIVVAIAGSALWFIPTAIIDAVCFKDTEAAMKKIFIWLVSLSHLLTALGFTFLFNSI